MNKVYTGGTFDLFHAGHANFLSRCSDLGRVVVVLNTDEFVERFKGKKPVMSYDEREAVLLSCKWVSHVVCNFGEEDSKPAINLIKPNLIIIGDDWKDKDYYKQMKFTPEWLRKKRIDLIYLPYTKGISSTDIKNRI